MSLEGKISSSSKAENYKSFYMLCMVYGYNKNSNLLSKFWIKLKLQ